MAYSTSWSEGGEEVEETGGKARLRVGAAVVFDAYVEVGKVDDTHGLPAMTQLVFNGGDYPVDGDAKLDHGIPVAEGDLFIV